jgi:hypothetical protein
MPQISFLMISLYQKHDFDESYVLQFGAPADSALLRPLVANYMGAWKEVVKQGQTKVSVFHEQPLVSYSDFT